MLATISDKKFGVPSGGSSLIAYYEPDIITAQDYFPFGMISREALPSGNVPYKFGFNGKMNDNDVKGGFGLQQDYGMRIYDPRVGRFLSVDPLTKDYAELTPYQFSSNRPIDGVDMDGGEWQPITDLVANKLKESGHPTLSTFVRGFGGLDVQAHGQQLANNVAKGNWHGVAKQLYSYSLKAQVDHLEETTKRAIDDNDQEAYGELYNFVFLGALGDAGMGEPPTIEGFKFSEHPVAKTNKVAIEAHGNFEAGEGNAANTTTNRVHTTGKEGSLPTSSKGTTIGLGIDEDLANHRGTGAITYKNAGWQQAGLTKVDWGRASMDEYSFMESFKNAADKAEAIRFDVTNFDPNIKGVTQSEFNHILSNKALYEKTTFTKRGVEQTWDGSKFIKK